MMLAGGVIAYQVWGGWWTLVGILAGVPAALIVFDVIYRIATMLEPRVK
jgi:hypothetical protein